MTFKTLLVFLDDGDESDARLDTACAMAVDYGAHISAVGSSLQVYTYFVAGPEGADTAFDLAEIEDNRQRAAKVASAARQTLIERKLSADARWISHEAIGLTEAAGRNARHADLTIVGQPRDDRNYSLHQAVLDGALFSSGRPVLLLPADWGDKPVARRIVVAWDASKEASRAIHDALPLIARAESTTVLIVDPVAGAYGWGEEPGADITTVISRHSDKTSLARIPSSGKSISDALLTHAADQAADLIVMGGYGHSQLRETIFGGVSRDMLYNTGIPLLMSH